MIRNSEAEEDGLDFVVTNNEFIGDFVAATQFEKDNTDLGFTINCNDYDNNSALAWYLHSDCDMAVVGECEPTETELAYRGSWHDIPTNSAFPFHIWDASNTLTDINYRNQEPEVLNLDVTQSCGPDDECIPSEVPCGGLRIAPIPPPSPVEPEEDRRYFVQQVQYKLGNKNYMGAIQDLEQRQEVWSDKILVANYIQQADYTKALQTLNRVPFNTADEIAFKNLFTTIVDNELIANESLIRYYAEDLSLNPRTNILAQSILGGYFNEKYIRNAAPIVSHSSKTSPKLPQKPFLQLLPNPAKNQLSLQWIDSSVEEDVELIIFNSVGQEAKIFKLSVARQKITIPIEDLKGGIYYVQVKGDKTIYSFDKIVIIK